MTEGARVLVIGAGFAGLACARALMRARVDVRVLEARDRVGGRVWTLRDLADGRPVEGGAMMVHGRRASVHRWIEEFGLTGERLPSFRGGRIYYEGRLRTPTSLILSSPGRLWAAAETFWLLPRAIARYRGPDVTLADFLAARRASRLATRFLAMMYGGINAAEAAELSVAGIAEEANASSLGLPWTNYRVAEGLDRIATDRAKDLGDRLHLRTRVERIEWVEGRVRVHARGPDGVEVHEGAAAAITVPLGVLKAGDVAFDPPLPEEKRRTIQAIGYGDALKVALAFDGAVKSALGRTVFLADEDGSFFFLPFYGMRDGPVVLEGFLPGRSARDLSGRPEAEILDRVLDEVALMIPEVDVRSVFRAGRVVDWTADPLSRGAYSFPAPRGGLAVRKKLAEPVARTLFFAGEATNYSGEYATIHGALDSGERAAREVLAALRS